MNWERDNDPFEQWSETEKAFGCILVGFYLFLGFAAGAFLMATLT